MGFGGYIRSALVFSSQTPNQGGLRLVMAHPPRVFRCDLFFLAVLHNRRVCAQNLGQMWAHKGVMRQVPNERRLIPTGRRRAQ